MHRQQFWTATEWPVGVALLLYQQFTCNKLSRLLAKHNIKNIHIPMRKTVSTLRQIKDDLGLKTTGVYCIPCECGKVYVGQTSSTIEIRCQEHTRHQCHGQAEQSTVAEYLLNTGHEIQFGGEKKKTEQENYLHGPDSERSYRL